MRTLRRFPRKVARARSTLKVSNCRNPDNRNSADEEKPSTRSSRGNESLTFGCSWKSWISSLTWMNQRFKAALAGNSEPLCCTQKRQGCGRRLPTAKISEWIYSLCPPRSRQWLTSVISTVTLADHVSDPLRASGQSLIDSFSFWYPREKRGHFSPLGLIPQMSLNFSYSRQLEIFQDYRRLWSECSIKQTCFFLPSK